MKLRDFIPAAHDHSLLSEQVRRYLDLEVIEEFSSCRGLPGKNFAFWMGPGQHVYHWVLLENGRGVGFNENPSWGWNFYVMTKKKTSDALSLTYHVRNQIK